MLKQKKKDAKLLTTWTKFFPKHSIIREDPYPKQYSALEKKT